MKNIWLLLIVFGLSIVAAPTLEAQQRRKIHNKKKSKKKEKSDFWKEDVWYGGSVGLGFSGNSSYSRFLIGATPMMGFKIKKSPFSVGPRLGVTYVSLKGVGTDGKIHKVGLPSYTTSAFARVKFLEMFFLHTEYELEWRKSPYADRWGQLEIDIDGNVLTSKERRNNFYIGAGYNPGNYEIMVLYNLSLKDDTLEQPFSIRTGFTWNF